MKTISTTKCFLTKFILIITHEQITKAKNGSNRYKQKIDKNNHEQNKLQYTTLTWVSLNVSSIFSAYNNDIILYNKQSTIKVSINLIISVKW